VESEPNEPVSHALAPPVLLPRPVDSGPGLHALRFPSHHPRRGRARHKRPERPPASKEPYDDTTLQAWGLFTQLHEAQHLAQGFTYDSTADCFALAQSAKSLATWALPPTTRHLSSRLQRGSTHSDQPSTTLGARKRRESPPTTREEADDGQPLTEIDDPAEGFEAWNQFEPDDDPFFDATRVKRPCAVPCLASDEAAGATHERL
jgi:hypothetical protein